MNHHTLKYRGTLSCFTSANIIIILYYASMAAHIFCGPMYHIKQNRRTFAGRLEVVTKMRAVHTFSQEVYNVYNSVYIQLLL